MTYLGDALGEFLVITIDLSQARPAEDSFSTHVERELAKIKAANPAAGKRVVQAL